MMRPDIPGFTEKIEQAEASQLPKLWRQFRFTGQPPRPGTIAEQRLHDVCENYVNLITVGQGAVTMPAEEDSENYRRPDDIRPSYTEQKVKISDEHRRNLHNQIAIMVYGQARSEMNSALAKTIADFACQYITGSSIDQL